MFPCAKGGSFFFPTLMGCGHGILRGARDIEDRNHDDFRETFSLFPFIFGRPFIPGGRRACRFRGPGPGRGRLLPGEGRAGGGAIKLLRPAKTGFGASIARRAKSRFVPWTAQGCYVPPAARRCTRQRLGMRKTRQKSAAKKRRLRPGISSFWIAPWRRSGLFSRPR